MPLLQPAQLQQLVLLLQPAQLQQQVPPLQLAQQDEKRDYLFITKARDRLHSCVPKYHGPRTDDWSLWKNQKTTACQNSLHPARDVDGRRFAIKEALRGEAAVQAQSVTKDNHYLTADEMLAELDKRFMPKQESALAKREFIEYKQHPDEPALTFQLSGPCMIKVILTRLILPSCYSLPKIDWPANM
ncbi:MAG: hypothetical protein GY696_39305 [Gammaproteobacteria bacterium]|nr:hypothetical protein [Gammaproteobacteria bacterium]